MKKVIKKTDLEAVVAEAYQKFKPLTEGENAHYIPFLANVDSDLFGIALTLGDGTVIEQGDTEFVFGIESISKVHNAILVLKQYGADKLLEIGRAHV